MDAPKIGEIYLNAATRERGYTWYHLVEGDAGRPAEREPQAYTAPLRGLIPHDSPTALLYQDGRAGSSRWGVFWGPMPTGQSDWIGRNMSFRLLAELPDLATAAGLFGGIVRDWWPQRENGVGDVGRLVSGALDGSSGGPGRLIDFLHNALQGWCAAEPAPVSGPVADNEPRIARPTTEHLQELGDYLRGPFRETSFVRSPAYSVVVIDLVIDVLIKALEPSSDSPPKVIRAVVQALGTIGPRARRARGRLIELTANSSVAAAVQEALERIG